MAGYCDKYRNTKIVKVKQTRYCAECGSPILKGSEALTINPKGIGRQWLCLDCCEADEYIEPVLFCKTTEELEEYHEEMMAQKVLMEIEEF